MGQFCRTRSKVWWPNYYQDEEDEAEDSNKASPHIATTITNNNNTTTTASWRRTGVNSSGSSRGSTSPSTGSQRSQDSGFSDSESSSSRSNNVNIDTSTATIDAVNEKSKIIEQQQRDEYRNDIKREIGLSDHKKYANQPSPINEVENEESIANCDVRDGRNVKPLLLPDTPVKMSKSSLLRRKNRRKKEEAEMKEKNLQLVKSKCSSISDYLAECYFPVYDFNRLSDNSSIIVGNDNGNDNDTVNDDVFSLSVLNDKDRSTNEEVVGVNLSTIPSNPSNDKEWSLSPSSSGQNRTCFIVDELPKRKSSSCASSSLISSAEKSDLKQVDNVIFNKADTRNLTYDITVVPRTPPPSSLVFEQNERQIADNSICCDSSSKKSLDDNRMSENLDETRFSVNSEILPPTYTSTPKKKFYSHTAPSSQQQSFSPKYQSSSRPQTNDKIMPDLHDCAEIPVNYWLRELRWSYQAECTITLQSKPILSSNVTENMSRTSTVEISSEYVTIMYDKARTIKEEFSNVYKKINRLAVNQTYQSLQNLISEIKEFLVNYAVLLPKSDIDMNGDLILLMDLCERLNLTARCPKFGESLLDEINTLGQTFSHFVNNLLITQVKILLSSLKDYQAESGTVMKNLSIITLLSTQIRHIGELVSYCDGVKYLLPLCSVSHASDVRTIAMRALAIICCYSKSLQQFEKDNGVQMLSEVLSDLTRPENELLEAVSVLVQITAPWVEDSQCIINISKHLSSLINSLTCLISTTAIDETLLLTAAALANISFIEPETVLCLLEAGTIECLLTAVRRQGTKVSVFLQEQTATLIANISPVTESRKHLADHRAVVALLCFLQVRHSPLQTPAEIRASERLQHKAAIALSRLCSDAEICRQVAELNGVHWLVHLCKEERERNYRDDVLVACLASLRKIAGHCGKSLIEELDAKELVEPRFLDSYFLYASRQESYV